MLIAESVTKNMLHWSEELNQNFFELVGIELIPESINIKLLLEGMANTVDRLTWINYLCQTIFLILRNCINGIILLEDLLNSIFKSEVVRVQVIPELES